MDAIGQKHGVQQGGEENNNGGGCGSYNWCARWKPTVEQLQILKDLYYNQMIRRPSTEEIERISLRLRQLGKIEGKNVFYWFQNQRNRERHPRKRPVTAIIAPPGLPDLHNNNYNNAAKRSKPPPQTLSLFPMHGDGDGDSDGDSSVSLELSLRPYSPKP
ncbi:WUSCHEL-related homeobox 7-like [Ipomoea triloba]|uniref:WUSCHEL-related homeobox 7-like n=1 Tax=Ipomoea triloba TaxID=35885 RepID=UPI00125CD745|nr:WUSCHEL-related homeobox 7-like [Ipomoea triloba]